ncbi:T9SS type A sorting domain-containing protein [Adhaeribacter sp. BT258]|uniref:T9SS type A sorting domain-containing protein n=1 Tax=Adhaeribacter terrigena TaxID=2793070 RepID=A0ABS1C6I9_9BACT|nr:T9SS type A sorting domain-containing protein [Adhaeribacter terrigena]MBK0404933.1 T9SS type A sorting domain-containing protein [Adhaeribacter terrigena]
MMLRRFTFFCFFHSIFILAGFAQQVDWVKKGSVLHNGSDLMCGFQRDGAGNFYVVVPISVFGNGGSWGIDFFGSTVQPPNQQKKYKILGKFDPNMNLLWTKTFRWDPTSYVLDRNHLAVDLAGNIYLADKDTTYKFTNTGKEVWKKGISGQKIRLNNQGQLEFQQFRNTNNTLNGNPVAPQSANVATFDTAGNYVRHFIIINPGYLSQVILGHNGTNYYGARLATQVAPFTGSYRQEIFTCDSIGTILDSGILNYNGYQTDNAGIFAAEYDPIYQHYYLAGYFKDRTPINKSDSTLIPGYGFKIIQVNSGLQVRGSLTLGPERVTSNFFDTYIYLAANKGSLYFTTITSRLGSSNSWCFTHLGLFNHHALQDNKVMMGKIDRNLNTIWYMGFGLQAPSTDIFPPIPTDNGIYYGGTSGAFTNTHFTFNSQGFSDMFLIKITDKDSTTAEVSGKIFNDINLNGVDDNEPGVVGQNISNNTVSGIAYSTSNGFFQTSAVTGQNTLRSGSLPKYWVRTTPDSLQINVPATASQLNGFNFGMRTVSGIKDAFVSLTPMTAARINMPAKYQLTVRNLATDVLSGQITMIKAPELTYQNASVIPDVISGDTLSWNYANLQPNEIRNIQINFTLQNNPSLVNKYLTNKATITPIVGDTATENNSTEIYHQVTGPIDPNDITVSPSCPIVQSFITDGKYLEYRIRFQNIGTDTAFSVVIHDTLSANLDLNTLEIVANSHNPRFWIKNNVLTIYFENIKLPHSTVNYTGSHGFFTYRIKPKTNTPLLATIKNKASIYFDFNEPIHTNQVTTQVTSNNILFTAVPQHINCYGDSTGSITINNNTCIKAPIRYSIDSVIFQDSPIFSQLKAGSYTIFIRARNHLYKLDSVQVQQPSSVNFSAISTPIDCYGDSTGVITISSNICMAVPLSYSTDSITFQSAPVFSQLSAGYHTAWIKAGNLSFRLDSIQVQQPDSIKATITYNHAASGNGDITINTTGGTAPYNYALNGSTSQNNSYFGNLSAGTYQVTIRDQNNCSKTYTIVIENISSVKESQLTNLKIYPNPFDNKLYVDTGKALRNARVQLYNSLGQLIFTQEIKNRQTTLEPPHLPKGLYLLKIISDNGISSKVVIKN